jgi:hypothetical protein
MNAVKNLAFTAATALVLNEYDRHELDGVGYVELTASRVNHYINQ